MLLTNYGGTVEQWLRCPRRQVNALLDAATRRSYEEQAAQAQATQHAVTRAIGAILSGEAPPPLPTYEQLVRDEAAFRRALKRLQRFIR